MATHRTTGSPAWAGWVVFASTMMVILGCINIIQGLVALFDDERLVIAADRLVAVDLTGWGWTILFFGAAMVLTGAGLVMGKTWGRVTGIILVAVHAITQVAWIGAYPVWSLLMIALDTVVLFALTARWSAAREALDPSYENYSASRPVQPTPAA
jgi:hypothetical protein